MYEHRDGIPHKTATEIAEMKKETLPNRIVEISASLMHETISSFRTAYMVAKDRLAYTKIRALNECRNLNQLHGAIIEHIA